MIAEEAKARVRKVITGRVRVTKRVREHEEAIDQTLAREVVEIRRVPKNQVVDGPQPTRETSDRVIVPVVRQVVRLEWILEEEIHLIKRRTTERSRKKVKLRREEPQIERIKSNGYNRRNDP